jgi:hypothetical protein
LECIDKPTKCPKKKSKKTRDKILSRKKLSFISFLLFYFCAQVQPTLIHFLVKVHQYLVGSNATVFMSFLKSLHYSCLFKDSKLFPSLCFNVEMMDFAQAPRLEKHSKFDHDNLVPIVLWLKINKYFYSLHLTLYLFLSEFVQRMIIETGLFRPVLLKFKIIIQQCILVNM